MSQYRFFNLFIVIIITFFLNACGDTYTSLFPSHSLDLPDYSKNRIASYNFDCSDPKQSADLRNITDQYYERQYYLRQMRVQSAWQTLLREEKCFGEGVTITVVDHPIEQKHEDLNANIDIAGSYNMHTGKKGEIPFPSRPYTVGAHGTMVAGIIAAGANGFGIVGIANKSRLQSYNLLGNEIEANEIIAMGADGDIINNSWGPPDNRPTLSPLPAVIKEAIDTKIDQGRGGRGTIYVWAAGNGGRSCGEVIGGIIINKKCNNNSNYDGYANYRKVIAVGALKLNRVTMPDGKMKKADFSEKGANILLSAPGKGITTTRVTPLNSNGRRYTNRFSGTSAAAPMISGTIALLLESNPTLGWRDVRAILARTASHVNVDSGDSDWRQNGAGLWINHKYGYGLVNVKAAVESAKNWINLPPEIAYTSSGQWTVNNGIPNNNGAHFERTLQVRLAETPISSLESVELIVDSDHTNWSNLTITLISPQGTPSIITEQHDCIVNAEDKCEGQQLGSMVFSSTRLLGENPIGRWTIRIKDEAGANSGKVNQITLNLYGS